jgi:hypothetical protein
LDSLKILDLSFNLIEFIPEKFLSDLLKLETLDLSHNRIYVFENFSIEKLVSLKDLHINDNADQFQIKSNSFFQLGSLQNIYISKSVLNNKQIEYFFNETFKYLNRNTTLKNNRSYFKSLSLITPLLGNKTSL